MSDSVKSGDMVSIWYTGKLEDGTVFDSNEGMEAFKFEAGGQQVITGMSEAVMGMQVGDEKTIEIPPEQAYGDPVEDLVISVAKDKIPEDVKVGDALSDGTPGSPSWVVTEVGDQEVVLDGNHPLAGKTLVFDVKLDSIG